MEKSIGTDSPGHPPVDAAGEDAAERTAEDAEPTQGAAEQRGGAAESAAEPAGTAAEPAEADPGWHEDLLGADFSALTLPLPRDRQATLVAHRPESDAAGRRDAWQPLAAHMTPDLLDDVAVLHLHGWSDYFFQSNLARFWTELGADFYALDLDSYGRNLDPARMERSVYSATADPIDPEVLQRPGFVTDLDEYDDDLEAALTVIARESPGRRVVLSAHSTGGLIAALWAHRNPERLHGLVLNSPWLEFQFTSAARKLLQPVIARTRAATSALRIHMPNHYAMATSAALGRIPYDMRLKPVDSFPVYAAWIRAIFAGHETVEKGLDIDAPVLVQTSNRSLMKVSYDQEMEESDIVLDVESIARRAVNIAPTVVLNRVPGGMHDLFISHPEAQTHAFAALLHFSRGYLTRDAGPLVE